MKFFRKLSKPLAAFIGLNMVIELLLPVRAWALTSGPTQPEVQSFQPVSVSDMVNPFTGDFSYNIPLIDIDGYPINLSYSSGIGSDQEASWVGLGWNINPGAITRSMRGLPDEFNGDVIEHEYNVRPNRTIGGTIGAQLEVLGLKKLGLGLKYSIGLNYNNYNGFGVEQTVTPTYSASGPAKGKFTASLGLTSGQNGLTVAPNLSYESKNYKTEKYERTRTTSIGSSFNSRGGLGDLTLSVKTEASKKRSGSGSSSGEINFGMSTYTPTINMPMRNYSVNFSYSSGAELVGVYSNGNISGYYSEQALNLDNGKLSVPAYGYINSQNVPKDDEGRITGMMDINRSWDGPYNLNTPSLPVTNYTFDILSVAGQGLGGSYRPFRNDFGYVSDNVARNISAGGSLGLEAGAGNLLHGGVDISVNKMETVTGNWAESTNGWPGNGVSYSNPAAGRLAWRGSGDDPSYEPYAFKEMGELSVDDEPTLFESIGSDQAVRIGLDANGAKDFEVRTKNVFETETGGTISIPTRNYRAKRIKRNQTLSIVSFDDLPYKGLGANDHALYVAPGHHVGEVSVIRNDGVRYVYGVPAYNTKQEETSFNVGMELESLTRKENLAGHLATIDQESGIVYYNSNSDRTGDNSVKNRRGKDHYYSETRMPAYAHSYLLSAVLSTDYVDVDGTRGPSDGDIGNYTVFKYKNSSQPFKWRTPFKNSTANYNEGIRNDYFDDKANYIYGEKEMWYLEKIETKNTIAIFTLEDRDDGWETAGRDGGFGTQSMKLLRKITLYSKPDYMAHIADLSNATPIKEVHFEYDYSLCPNTENNINFENGSTDPSTTGKLTLKKVYFTYGTSTKSAFSPYTFDYTNLHNSSFNPEYGLKNHDRWGNYKPNSGHLLSPNLSGHTNSEFSYTEQYKVNTDQYATAWTLSKINLPSGGTITIHAESDDYAYVQDKKAMQMFKIVSVAAVENPSGGNADFFDGNNNSLMESSMAITDANRNNLYLTFELQETIPNVTGAVDVFRKKYLDGINDKLYFKALVAITPQKHDNEGNLYNYEYVSGYAEIEASGIKSYNNAAGDYNYGWIKLKAVDQGDNTIAPTVNPISKAAWHFGRANMSSIIYENADAETPGISQFVTKLQNSGLAKQIIETIQGANGHLKLNDYGKKILPSKSFIRLLNPTGKKLGGGLRVKKVELNDEWEDMISTTGNNSQTYGQEYSYTTVDEVSGETISSGVASWEPQIGGDENPFHLPVWFGDKDQKLLIPDDQSYFDGPMGEEFYPSASVGYRKVTVKNLSHEDIKRHGTGTVVNEFYTAKEFPTISRSTGMDPKARKTNPLFRLFKVYNRDYTTVSQGHIIELNDMHGKQKAMWVYPEDDDKPISGVEYKYQCEAYGNGSWKLKNDAIVVYPDGHTDTRQIGVEFDFVADFREQRSSAVSGGLNTNVSSFLAAFIPGIVPTVFPSAAQEYTRFRSAVATKIINRYGILQETIAHDLGSKVSTNNLAYDSETGLVLLTKTKNNFEDEIYSFNYPAHWYYDAMGQAYKNLGMQFGSLTISSGGVISMTDADDYFVPGDELVTDHKHLAWVKAVDATSVTLINEMGNAFYPPGGTITTMVITRSGRRNLIGVSMGTITGLSNPLDGLRTNKFFNVLNTSAQVFKDHWKTFCECFAADGSIMKNSKNPYAIGNLGIWRAYKSFAYLVERQHSWKNNNTDVRKDGVYASFNPYWKWNGTGWERDETNWTWTAEVTEMSPYGAELENMDALNRFSAATYGYNNTIPTSVGANTKYQEIAFDGFEDYDFVSCAVDHFSYKPDKDHLSTEAHTGKASMTVSSGNSRSVTKTLTICEEE